MKEATLSKISGRVHGLLVDLILGVISNRLDKQEHHVDKTDWANLIVLDACRYDYLEKEYRNFFRGVLKRVCSPASETYSWLNTIFNKRCSITVYSAHPAINSLGVERGGYKAVLHFERIVDVWRSGWDDKLTTVPPNAVNKAVIGDIKSGILGSKNIIWYMQPYAPWIGEVKLHDPEKPPPWKGEPLTILY